MTNEDRPRFGGLDPGGAGQLGWCVMGGSALPLSLIRAGRAGDASAAVRAVLGVLGPSVPPVEYWMPLVGSPDKALHWPSGAGPASAGRR